MIKYIAVSIPFQDNGIEGINTASGRIIEIKYRPDGTFFLFQDKGTPAYSDEYYIIFISQNKNNEVSGFLQHPTKEEISDCIKKSEKILNFFIL